MPNPQQWQAAIAERAFPLKIDMDFDIVTLRGWLPCEYQGKPGGFEFYYSVLGADELRDTGIPEAAPCQIMFSTHAPKAEFLSAIIAAAVLAEMTGGMLMDSQEGRTYKGAEAIVWAKAFEKTYENPAIVPRAGKPGGPPCVPRPGLGKLFLGGVFFIVLGSIMLLSKPPPLGSLVAIASLAMGVLGFVACVKAFWDGKKNPQGRRDAGGLNER